MKDEESEATQSNDLKNNSTWFTAAKKICDWDSNSNITSSHKGTIDAEDPVLFADYQVYDY